MIKINCDICGTEIDLEVHNKLQSHDPFLTAQEYVSNYDDLCEDCFHKVKELIKELNKEHKISYEKKLEERLNLLSLKEIEK